MANTASWAGQVGGWLREALSTEELTDFTLTCIDGEVKCHKLLLLAQGGLLETRVRDMNRPNQEILVPDWLITSHVT